jgi:hypothetical protein
MITSTPELTFLPREVPHRAAELSLAEAARVKVVGGGVSSTAIAGQSVTSIGAVVPSDPFSGAQFASGGVGLRNRGTGAISINGVATPVKSAFVYWAVITSGPAPTADQSIMVQRLSPAPASAVTTVAGQSGARQQEVNDIDASQVKDGDRVICKGTWDKNGVLHATLISKRLTPR